MASHPSSTAGSKANLNVDADNGVDEKIRHKHSGRNRPRAIVIAAGATVLLVALALGLGLGLGLGLKKHNHAEGKTASGMVPRSQLVDPSQLQLSSSFNVAASPQTRTYDWTITQIMANPAGVEKPMLVVNNLSPGPLIEANLHDTIVVNVRNLLNVTTAIHWHGQSQNGTNFMDGTYGVTECGISPGSTFTYNWTVQNVGTYWWHAHAMAQYTDGLFGPMVLHSPDEPVKMAPPSTSTSATIAHNTTYDEDLIFMVGDVYNLPSPLVTASYFTPCGPNGDCTGDRGSEPVPDAGLVNGYGKSNCAFAPDGTSCDGGDFYQFTVQPNERYRLRIINAGSLASVRFSVDGHAMTVIEADGTPIVPQKVSSLMLTVAQRYSVIIETNQKPGACESSPDTTSADVLTLSFIDYLRGEVATDMFAYDNPGIVTTQNAVMRYSGTDGAALPTSEDPPALSDGSLTELDTSSLVPSQALNPPQATKQDKLVVTFGLTATSDFRAFFNSTSWSPLPQGQATLFQQQAATLSSEAYTPAADDSQLVLTYEGIEVVDLIINNQDDGDHPFHLHSYAPWFLGSGPGNYLPSSLDLTQEFKNPMRRDVFIVPAYSWAVVRFVADTPGMWAFHCHLAWHMEAGLFAQIAVQPQEIAKLQMPQSLKDQCASFKG